MKEPFGRTVPSLFADPPRERRNSGQAGTTVRLSNLALHPSGRPCFMANPSDQGTPRPAGPAVEPFKTGTATPSSTASHATPSTAPMSSASSPTGSAPERSPAQPFRVRTSSSGLGPRHRDRPEGNGADRHRRGPSAGGPIRAGRRPRTQQDRGSAEGARRRGDPPVRARHRQRCFRITEPVSGCRSLRARGCASGRRAFRQPRQQERQRVRRTRRRSSPGRSRRFSSAVRSP